MNLRTKIAVGGITLASASLMAFLGLWEGEGQNTVYADRLAGGLPTVCKGITRHTSPSPVIVGDYWSEERCAEVEQMVTEKTQLKLADCISNQNVEQKTFDALTSHAHNVGVPSTCASRAVGLINRGRIAEGCNALAWAADGTTPVWAFVTKGQQKVFVRGLHYRRLAEVDMCLEGLKHEQNSDKPAGLPVAVRGPSMVAVGPQDGSAGKYQVRPFPGNSQSGEPEQYAAYTTRTDDRCRASGSPAHTGAERCAS